MPTLPKPTLLEWIAIPPGRYWMGGILEDKFVTAVELPQHEVTIPRKFFISQNPVTNEQWLEIMGTLPPAAILHADRIPVVGITWSEALLCCHRLTKQTGCIHRLPTESEWEYACRAGSMTVFPDGNNLSPTDANFLYNELGATVGPGHLTEINSYRPNRFGVCDMVGNVCEWTADTWHPGFDQAPADGIAWIRGGRAGRRVIRGGAWDHLPRVLRASWRDWAPETARWDNLGFRMVRELMEP